MESVRFDFAKISEKFRRERTLFAALGIHLSKASLHMT
jgi:hypothetical protein